MSGGMDRNCGNCYYDNGVECTNEGRCDFFEAHKFPEELEQPIKKENIPFFLQEQNPIYSDEELTKISPLNKLINDHWSYNYDLLTLAMPLDIQGWGREEVLDLVEFVYKAAWKHGRKHALEDLGLDPKEVK